jgi:DUF1680 family protein
MELVLYNSGLSGIGLDGMHYFYTNPLRRLFDEPLLRWDKPTRQPMLECFCCPSNVARTIIETNAYAYNISDKSIWINLYGSNQLNTELPDGSLIKISQYTDYPWAGTIKIKIDKSTKISYTIRPRIPGWVREAALYINGETQTIDLKPGTYAEIKRNWVEGDSIELSFSMPVEYVQSHPQVKDNKNQIAIKRGPVVYCLESVDLPDSLNFKNIVFNPGSKLRAVYKKDFLGGIVILEGKASLVSKNKWEGDLYNPLNIRSIDIRLIPYYAWSNRGISEMAVWLPVSSF